MSFQQDVLPRSVGRIRVSAEGGTIQGTGFLVGPTRVLTCAHCVAGTTSGFISFSEVSDSSEVPFEVVFTRLEPELGLDVAVLKLEREVAGSSVLPLAHAAITASALEWKSFGHPSVLQGVPLWLRGTADGVVGRRSGDRNGALLSLHVNGESASLVGFSGAPVLTDNGVIGIFSYQLYALARAENGAALAAPAFSKGFAVPTALLQKIPEFSAAVAPKAKVFIAYRHGDVETPLMEALRSGLAAQGHRPQADGDLVAGDEWTQRLVAMLDDADVFVPILTERSMESPVLLQELRLAYRRRRQTGRPMLLPLRDPGLSELPYEFDTYVGSLHFVPWRGPVDTPSAVQSVTRAVELRAPKSLSPLPSAETAPSTPPLPFVRVRPSATALPTSDAFYLEREVDARIYDRAEAERFAMTLRAPSGFGKSSLALRLRQRLMAEGRNTLMIDFEVFGRLPEDDGARHGYLTFLNDFAQVLCMKFGMEPPTQPVQNAIKVQEILLRALEAKPNSVLILDGLHRLIARPYAEDFFAACRAWVNDSQLTSSFVFCIAIKPETLMVDINRSPFNIDSNPLELGAFTPADIATLATRAGVSLEGDQVDTLYQATGGHPAMTRQGLSYLLASGQGADGRPTSDQLKERSNYIAEHAGAREGGPFSTSLKSLLTKLNGAAARAPSRPHPEEVLRKIIRNSPLTREEEGLIDVLEVLGAIRSDAPPSSGLLGDLVATLEAWGLRRASAKRARFRPFNMAIARMFDGSSPS